MSRGKGGEIRRNDGFRIADARQVRIEALEKTVQKLRRELDTARLDVERAQREVRAMCAANDGLTKQRDETRGILADTQRIMESLRQSADARMRILVATNQELERARAERVTWWDRLFGAKA
jgi:predicted  nucleic acid-binding Zn-ribbon protein